MLQSIPTSCLFSPPHLFVCFSSQSILLLQPIVFFFFSYLILLSSFSPLLQGAALLSIFITRPGKKADRSRTERIATLNLVISPPVLPGFTSFLFYLRIHWSLTAILPQFYTFFLNTSTFHPQLCLDLYTFLSLNFYFSLDAALNLDAVFSLTPTTICSFLLTVITLSLVWFCRQI